MPKIVRKRTILACKRCFESKRKCDHKRPTCVRCLKANARCEYFTESQIKERIQRRRSREESPDEHTTPTTEVDPEPRQLEKQNFKLLVNENGEYSKYFPVCLFPFCEHSANVAFVVDKSPSEWDAQVTFDFSALVRPLSTLDEIKRKFPHKKLAIRLLDWYATAVHPYVPIVDCARLRASCEHYWDNKQEFKDLNALILLFAVFFCSIQSLQLAAIFQKDVLHTEPELPLDYQHLKRHYYQCIVSLSAMLNMTATPSLSCLSAMVLVYYVGSLNCINMVGETAMLVKCAQVMGLHRSVYRDSPRRNMLYSYIWYLDSLSSYYTGLAPSTNPDYFGTPDIRQTSVPALYSRARFLSAEVCNDILAELNKITLSTTDSVLLIKDKFNSTLLTVNNLNKNIVSAPDEEPTYLHLLVSESRMGLWKAALLLHILQTSIGVEPPLNNLVLYAMLLVNESLMKIALGRRLNPGCLWFARCSYPIQAMFIVLSSVQNAPHAHLNFGSLPEFVQFTPHPELSYLEGDLRLPLVDKCIEALETMRPIWPMLARNRLDRVLKVRDQLKSEQYGDGLAEFITSWYDSSAWQGWS